MQRLTYLLVFLFAISNFAYSQEQINEPQLNAAETMLQKDGNLTIGGYAQIDYNQKLDKDLKQNGKMDIHRLVMLFGYKFNKRTSFVTELEFEHVTEVYVEQAFLDYKINEFINFRGGLLLIPMGIINEYHEPPTYFGVERPNIDSKLVPTTWREIGAGFTGRINSLGLKYQLYVVNGFNGYNGKAKFNGAKGLRGGRQKGAESFISSPNLSMKVDYYGMPGLKLGLAGYFGKSQSTLYNGIDKDDDALMAKADSSVVGTAMIGFDATYKVQGLHLKGQLNYIKLSNTDEYNEFGNTNVGETLGGFYLEAGYDVLHSKESETELIPFVRYENYNTHQSVAGNLQKNDAYAVQEIITGLNWKLSKGAVLKADLQFTKTKADDDWQKTLNMGIGVWF